MHVSSPFSLQGIFANGLFYMASVVVCQSLPDICCSASYIYTVQALYHNVTITTDTNFCYTMCILTLILLLLMEDKAVNFLLNNLDKCGGDIKGAMVYHSHFPVSMGVWLLQ